MKVGALVSLGLLAFAAEATTILTVDSCEDLADAVAATSTDKIEGVLASGGVTCDSWTTFEVTDNRLKLVAPDTGYASEDVFAFFNVRFVVASSAILRVLPKVEFSGTEGSFQEVNGGVLNVADGGRVRFKDSVYMHDVEVRSVTGEDTDFTTDIWFGGCIYNSGLVRFDDAFDAERCETDGGGESAPGDGSGIWNGSTGQVVIKGTTTINDCGTRDINGNRGGAIYNEGKFSMFDDAAFTDNQGSAGGAIYNIGTLKFLKDSLPTFTGNRASDTGGGHVKNVTPGEMKFNGGGVFVGGRTEDSGGAIFNTGALSISKFAEFTENFANSNGGAIFNLASSGLVLPEDTTFSGNTISDPPTFSDCENIYSFDEDGSFECLP